MGKLLRVALVVLLELVELAVELERAERTTSKQRQGD